MRRKPPALAAPPTIWRNRLHVFLVFVTIVLVVDGLVGDKGFVETLRARRESKQAAAALIRLRAENARLREQARRLLEDRQTIESIARKELGLIRPGEVMFIMKDVKPSKRQETVDP